MDRGFESFAEEPGPEGRGGNAAATFAAAGDWLAEHASEPFFLLVHTYEAHMPYTHRDFAAGLDPGRVGPTYELDFLERVRAGEVVLTDAERAYIRALYDGGILAADRQLGRLLARLAELGIADRTLIVVTSDHGEELGDAFPLYIGGHGHSLHDNLLLVPLLLRDPTRPLRGVRIADQVRSIDVLPTVVDLLGIPLPPGIAGRSLLPLLLGAETGNRVAMSAETNRGAARVGIRTGRHKLVRVVEPGAGGEGAWPGLGVPELQLFDLEADPGEESNLAEAKPRLARSLANRLARWWNGLGESARSGTAPDVADDELRRRLESLGYVDPEPEAR
jgi:arylsulfatase A-like enzyme